MRQLGLGVETGADPGAMDSDSWFTPQWILDLVAKVWPDGIGTDPCWHPSSLVEAGTKWTIKDDGLTKPWLGHVWCNPPYSAPGPWLERCIAHQDAIALVKVDTSTDWWRRYVWSADAICFLYKRVQFCGRETTSGNNFASALVCWGPSATDLLTQTAGVGHGLKPCPHASPGPGTAALDPPVGGRGP